MYKHILITTDGSDLAQKGVEHGLALAKENASKVTVVTVSQTYPLLSAATSESWNATQTQLAEDALRAAKTAADRHGVAVSARQDVNVSPAEAIVETARKLGCDLIVMASHGRRGVSRLLLGSQTAEVVNHSPIPVLVVR